MIGQSVGEIYVADYPTLITFRPSHALSLCFFRSHCTLFEGPTLGINTQDRAAARSRLFNFEAFWGEAQWSDLLGPKWLLSLYTFLRILFFLFFTKTITQTEENAVSQMSFG